jgi:hypothetical protein
VSAQIFKLGVDMNKYHVDRSLLEAYSTEEILNILSYEKEDYTPQAIAVLEDILRVRGAKPTEELEESAASCSSCAACAHPEQDDLLIATPTDAVHVLNDLLKAVLDGTIEPDVAQAAAALVTGILRAIEQEDLSELEES